MKKILIRSRKLETFRNLDFQSLAKVMTREKKTIVTGSSGFIGSHLCEALLRRPDQRIIAIDKNGPPSLIDDSSVEFCKMDLSSEPLESSLTSNVELVFHLAANPEVKIGFTDSLVDYKNNIVATRELLESLKTSGFHGKLIFASTSTVYGEASVIPTPEEYGPLLPISMYGATKLACESLISAYARLFHFNARIVRFANVVGARSKHGIVFDFVQKLRANPTKLEILGDGTQNKSYVHIVDCVSGLLKTSVTSGLPVDVYNLGTGQTTSVLRIASIIIEAMRLPEVSIETGHGIGENGSGWPGDVKNMLLDCKKLITCGWECRFTSDEAIRQTASEMQTTLPR
jgi:UDP-glucose 4-epimerase